MFVRRTVIAAALVAVPLAFAASAQATPAAIGAGDRGDKGICGCRTGRTIAGRTDLTTNYPRWPGHTAG